MKYLFDLFAKWVATPNPLYERIRKNAPQKVEGGTYLQEPIIYERPDETP